MRDLDAPEAPDRPVIEAQMGRPLRGRSQVVSRCALGLPVVVRVEPLLEDGTPFPTLHWLTCPLARIRVSRLEQRGGVRDWERRLAGDPGLAAAQAAAEAAYAAERAALLAPDDPGRARLRGGVGGSAGGVKCLHAHYAHARTGRADPVGEDVLRRVEPLDCARPCVVGGARDPAWREPRP